MPEDQARKTIRRPSSQFNIIHADYVSICGGSVVQAVVLNLLDSLSASKGQDWIEVSLRDIKKLTFCWELNTVQSAISELVKAGFVRKRSAKGIKSDLMVNTDAVQSAIDSLYSTKVQYAIEYQ